MSTGFCGWPFRSGRVIPKEALSVKYRTEPAHNKTNKPYMLICACSCPVSTQESEGNPVPMVCGGFHADGTVTTPPPDSTASTSGGGTDTISSGTTEEATTRYSTASTAAATSAAAAASTGETATGSTEAAGTTTSTEPHSQTTCYYLSVEVSGGAHSSSNASRGQVLFIPRTAPQVARGSRPRRSCLCPGSRPPRCSWMTEGQRRDCYLK